MSLTRPRWVAKHTFGEHLEVPPRLLGIVKDGVGDRPGNAPGPQGLELLRDMANDWHKARVNVSERGATLSSWGSESTTDRNGLAKAVALLEARIAIPLSLNAILEENHQKD